MAAPSKLTPELQEKLCSVIRACACSVEAAAAAVGVDSSTLRRWRARGMIEEDGPYRAFCTALTHAREHSEATLSALIARAGQEDWRAAAFLLERRFPDRYGNQIKVLNQIQRMSDDELDAFIASQLAADAPGGEDRPGGEALEAELAESIPD